MYLVCPAGSPPALVAAIDHGADAVYVGFRDQTIRAIFIFEALLVGFVGAALGWIFGYLLTRGLASLEFKTPFSDYNHLPVIYSAKHYLLATTVALLSSLVAGYFPARAAARLHPVDIIRGAT